jgi:hypothetical protein
MKRLIKLITVLIIITVQIVTTNSLYALGCWTLVDGSPCVTSGALLGKYCYPSPPENAEACLYCDGNEWFYAAETVYPKLCSLLSYEINGKTECYPHPNSTVLINCSVSHKMVWWQGRQNPICKTYWVDSAFKDVPCEIDSLGGDACVAGG